MAYLIHCLYFVYVVEVFVTLNCKPACYRRVKYNTRQGYPFIQIHTLYLINKIRSQTHLSLYICVCVSERDTKTHFSVLWEDTYFK